MPYNKMAPAKGPERGTPFQVSPTFVPTSVYPNVGKLEVGTASGGGSN